METKETVLSQHWPGILLCGLEHCGLCEREKNFGGRKSQNGAGDSRGVDISFS